MGKFTILVVESDVDSVALLKLALTRAGIDNPVQVVKNGAEAVDYLCGRGAYQDRSRYPFPKVMFTEIKLPRMGGFEVLEWLRNHPNCSVIPVIVLSASSEDEDIRRAYQMGANAYLIKPSALDDLQQMVKTAFEFWKWCVVPKVQGNC